MTLLRHQRAQSTLSRRPILENVLELGNASAPVTRDVECAVDATVHVHLSTTSDVRDTTVIGLCLGEERRNRHRGRSALEHDALGELGAADDDARRQVASAVDATVLDAIDCTSHIVVLEARAAGHPAAGLARVDAADGLLLDDPGAVRSRIFPERNIVPVREGVGPTRQAVSRATESQRRVRGHEREDERQSAQPVGRADHLVLRQARVRHVHVDSHVMELDEILAGLAVDPLVVRLVARHASPLRLQVWIMMTVGRERVELDPTRLDRSDDRVDLRDRSHWVTMRIRDQLDHAVEELDRDARDLVRRHVLNTDTILEQELALQPEEGSALGHSRGLSIIVHETHFS